MANNKDIEEFSIGELFKGNNNYLIPIYQRNYTWGKGEVEQLVIDINDYHEKNSKQNYYIGTLVVYQKDTDEVVFETIDGQQRLTTLFILLSVLKNDILKNDILKYESRKISTDTLKYIYDGNVEQKENLNPAMINAYRVLKEYFKQKGEIGGFTEYLLNNVKILRVNVPKDTDLNHYFEIMNNRGEQLEKHEILKARMLEKLNNNNNKKVFNTIWEVCSDMSRYIQYGFKPDVRRYIFGENWNNFICTDFNKIVETVKPTTENEEDDFSIDQIIDKEYKLPNSQDDKQSDDKPDRFTSPINFPNFLLHVLKVTKTKEVPLDDKRLLDTFEVKEYDEEFVKEFGYNLLKIRFLFDNYIIKREHAGDKDEWSLKQVYKNNNNNGIQYKNRFENEEENEEALINKKNKKILMILSMFHVSNPSQIYKYWLTGALHYLFNNCGENSLDAANYLEYLEKLAELFLRNRYLAENPEEFEKIIFNESTILIKCIDSKLNQGTSVAHFIFNYLDYLLWKQNLDKKENEKKDDFSYFSFSFSNSIEHFYPQNPIESHPKLEDDKINNFGNLCLISVSKNAKLNNHPPKSKKAYYENSPYDSLKQHIMMKKADNWNKDAIEAHREEMIKVLEPKETQNN